MSILDWREAIGHVRSLAALHGQPVAEAVSQAREAVDASATLSPTQQEAVLQEYNGLVKYSLNVMEAERSRFIRWMIIWLTGAIVLIAVAQSFHTIGSTWLDDAGLVRSRVWNDYTQFSQTAEDMAAAQTYTDARLKQLKAQAAALADHIMHMNVRSGPWMFRPGQVSPEEADLISRLRTVAQPREAVVLAGESKHILDAQEADMAGTVEWVTRWVNLIEHFFFPLVWGFLGSGCYVMRRFVTDSQDFRADERPIAKHKVRLCLGVGVALSIGLFTQWMQSENLSPSALAFLAGYGVEMVFGFYDRLIEKFQPKTEPA